MRSTLLLPAILLLLSPTASAWGEVTHEYICRKALEGAYTLKDVEGCLGDTDLNNQTAFCHTIREHVDEESYLRCIDETYDKVVIKPYVMPYMVFNDAEEHRDYARCPITYRNMRGGICGEKNNTPATDNSERWLKIAESATTKCERIKMLCIASNYYADAHYPLNQVKYLVGCLGSLKQQVDEKMSMGGVGWEVKEYCIFKFPREGAGRNHTIRYQQAFRVTDDEINMIASNLSERFKTIAEKPLKYVETEVAKKTRKVDAGETKVDEINTSVSGENITQKKVGKEDYINQTIEAFNEMLKNVEDAIKSLGGKPSDVVKQKQSENTLMMVFTIIVVLSGLAFMAYVALKKKTGRIKKPWDVVDGEVDLTKIGGVTAKIASELREGGYFTVEDVVGASEEELKKIPGINQKNVSRILDNAKKHLRIIRWSEIG